MPTKREAKDVCKWKPYRWWVSLCLFILASAVVGSLLEKMLPSGIGDVSVSVMMVVFISWASRKDRTWKVYERIMWVVGAIVFYFLFQIPISLLLNYTPLVIFVMVTQIPVDRLVMILAACPIVIYAMRRSKYFIDVWEIEDRS